MGRPLHEGQESKQKYGVTNAFDQNKQTKNNPQPKNNVAEIQLLSAGAKVKCRDRVLGKGGNKITLLLCQAKEGHSRPMPGRLCPSLEVIVRGFTAKRRKTGFQIGIRIGTDMHSSFFGES